MFAEAEIQQVRAFEANGQHEHARAIPFRADHKLAPAHAALGLWDEKNGMKSEATAHITTAVRLDPYRELNWKNLRYVKHNGRWMSHEQIQSAEHEDLDQRQADRHWEPLLRKWKMQVAEKAHADRDRHHLSEVHEPRVVSLIVRVFEDSRREDQGLAARLLGQIESVACTRELSVLAVRSDRPPVRQAAIDLLCKRESRDYAEIFVEMIRAPWSYEVSKELEGHGPKGVMVIDFPRFHLVKTYDAPRAFDLGSTFCGSMGYDPNGLPRVISGFDLDRYRSHRWEDASILRANEQTFAQAVSTAEIADGP